MRKCVADNSDSLKWVVFDGPVDALWIESIFYNFINIMLFYYSMFWIFVLLQAFVDQDTKIWTQY